MSACKYCGRHGFRWQQSRYGWRLYSNDGIHKCVEGLAHHAAEVKILNTKPSATMPAEKLTSLQAAVKESRAAYFDPKEPPYVPRVRPKQVHPLAWLDAFPSAGFPSGPEFEFT